MVAGPGENGVTFARQAQRLLVALLAVGTVAALFLLRAADDNRLTSWQWTFADADPIALYAVLGIAIAAAYAVATLPLPGRRPAAVLFVASYAVGAFFWRAPETIVDASRYFTQAKHLEVYGLGYFLSEWGSGIAPWTDLPLVPFLYGLVFLLFGESRVHVQAFTTLLFALSVVLTYRIGEDLWDEEVGFAAGALLLGVPYLLLQVPSMLVDVPAMFFLTLAVFAVLRALARGTPAAVALAAVAVSLAVLSKYSVALLLSVVPIIALIRRGAGARRPVRTVLAIGLASGALVAAAVLLHREAYSEQIALLLSYQAPGLRRWGESFASTFLFQVHPFLTAAALASIAVAIRRRDPRLLVAAWPLLLLVALEVRRSRYLVPALPMLALMGAYGLQAIGATAVRRFVVTCTVASSIAVAAWGYLPFLQGTSLANVKHAGEYLDSIDEERVEVFTPSPRDPEVNPAVAVPLLDLFTSKQVVYRYDGAPADAKARAARSALRFTWEYRNPEYYAATGAGRDAAVVIISDHGDPLLPRHLADRLVGHRLARVFAADEGVFRYRTMVTVYRPAPSPERAPAPAAVARSDARTGKDI